MIALVNNFSPKTGIGKYSFNLFEKAQKLTEIQMLYLESKDNKIPETNKIKKIIQSVNFPVFNKSFSWYYFFPSRIPKNYSLYHLSSQYLSRIAEFNKPCIVTHMDLAPILFPKEYPFHIKFLLKKVLPFYEKMERILTISEPAKKELIDYSGIEEEKIVSIPLGFDESIFRPMNKQEARKKLGLPLDKKIILNIGSEEPRKNIPCLLKAYNELEKERKDTLLVRIGNKNKDYEKQKKGINILELNKIEEQQLPLYYNAADLFIFPATYEGGFAFPPLEAMACGTPVILGKELELFKEGTELVDVSDFHNVLDSAREILSNENKARTLSKKALEDSKKFTLTEEARKTVEVYNEVLGIK
jgi:glycosyltransferase involved in cell wall biosynthesis